MNKLKFWLLLSVVIICLSLIILMGFTGNPVAYWISIISAFIGGSIFGACLETIR